MNKREFADMNMPRAFYSASDLAFIIPTKDRPQKLKNLLESFATQTVSCGRLIIIDGGHSVENLVMSYSGKLPVEYYECRPPGQIRQKNMGISLLDEKTPLVGFLDDDIVLEPYALKAIISFWNSCGANTAGISFNIINVPAQRHFLLGSIFGLSVPEPGRVLRSGITTANYPAQTNLRTQWLCGGATIWKQDILKAFSHNEIQGRWAIAEDLIFSYPVGKRFSLYVCADARVRHEHVMDYVSKMKHRFHGRTQTIWWLYFVELNDDLSRTRFFFALFVRIIGRLMRGMLTFRIEHLEFVLGQVEGAIKGLKSILYHGDLVSLMAEEEDAKKNE